MSGVCARIVMLVASMAASCAVFADWKPEKPVEIVVGRSPGGGLERPARLLQKLSHDLRLIEVPINVVNKPGGSGTIAWIYLNQRPGDGHYLAIDTYNLVTNLLTGVSNLNYTDFTPLAHLGSEYIAFSVRADSSLKSARDLLDRLKTDAAALSVAVGNSLGNTNHIALALVARAAGADLKKLKTVVFRSGREPVLALLGGHIDVVSGTAGNVLPHVQTGKLRVIGVAARERLKGELSDVPTLHEQGVNVVVSNWRVVIGPRGMTQGQIGFWEGALGRIVQSQEWKTELERSLWEAQHMNSGETRRYLDAQNAEFKAVLGDLGMAK